MLDLIRAMGKVHANDIETGYENLVASATVQQSPNRSDKSEATGSQHGNLLGRVCLGSLSMHTFLVSKFQYISLRL